MFEDTRDDGAVSALTEQVLHGRFEELLSSERGLAEEDEYLLRFARFFTSVPTPSLASLATFLLDSGEFLLAVGITVRLCLADPSDDAGDLKRAAEIAYRDHLSGVLSAKGYPFVARRFTISAYKEMTHSEYLAALKLYQKALRECPFDPIAMRGAARCHVLLGGTIEELELISAFEKEVRGDEVVATWFAEAASTLRQTNLSPEQLALKLIREKLERDFMI